MPQLVNEPTDQFHDVLPLVTGPHGVITALRGIERCSTLDASRHAGMSQGS
jgi:hypothetical protein